MRSNFRLLSQVDEIEARDGKSLVCRFPTEASSLEAWSTELGAPSLRVRGLENANIRDVLRNNSIRRRGAEIKDSNWINSADSGADLIARPGIKLQFKRLQMALKALEHQLEKSYDHP